MTDGFSEAWNELKKQGMAELRDRRAVLNRLFAAGGADEADFDRHFMTVVGALKNPGGYETLAVLLRAFGLSEELILTSIKRRCISGGKGGAYARAAIREAGIAPDEEALREALEEIDEQDEVWPF